MLKVFSDPQCCIEISDFEWNIKCRESHFVIALRIYISRGWTGQTMVDINSLLMCVHTYLRVLSWIRMLLNIFFLPTKPLSCLDTRPYSSCQARQQCSTCYQFGSETIHDQRFSHLHQRNEWVRGTSTVACCIHLLELKGRTIWICLNSWTS